MQVWENPTSLADGILDDETYDWIGVFEAMRRSGGSPIVASEAAIERAHSLAVDAGFDTSHTGSAGLAGLLAIRHEVDDAERVVRRDERRRSLNTRIGPRSQGSAAAH